MLYMVMVPGLSLKGKIFIADDRRAESLPSTTQDMLSI